MVSYVNNFGRYVNIRPYYKHVSYTRQKVSEENVQDKDLKHNEFIIDVNNKKYDIWFYFPKKRSTVAKL